MRDGFSRLHSAVLFVFYAIVLAVTMLVLHPAYIVLSALGAAAYLVSLAGWRGLLQRLRWVVPLALIAVLFNLAFNHRGVTALFYLKNGNAVTLESLVFGLCAGGMLAAAVLWFSSFHMVFTSEKLMALSGRFAPALSLSPAGSTDSSEWLSSTRSVPPSGVTVMSRSRRPSALRRSSRRLSAWRANQPSSGWDRLPSSSLTTTTGRTTLCSANFSSAQGSERRTEVSMT